MKPKLPDPTALYPLLKDSPFGLSVGVCLSITAGLPMPYGQLAIVGLAVAGWTAGRTGAIAAASVLLLSFGLFGARTIVELIGMAAIAAAVVLLVPESWPWPTEPIEDEPTSETALVVDCEGFAELDQIYGDGASDHAFRMLQKAIRTETRDGDTVTELGSLELALVLRNAGPDAPRLVMERFEARFRAWLVDAGYECELSVGLVDAASPAYSAAEPRLGGYLD